jgi:hypothetical protein
MPSRYIVLAVVDSPMRELHNGILANVTLIALRGVADVSRLLDHEAAVRGDADVDPLATPEMDVISAPSSWAFPFLSMPLSISVPP